MSQCPECGNELDLPMPRAQRDKGVKRKMAKTGPILILSKQSVLDGRERVTQSPESVSLAGLSDLKRNISEELIDDVIWRSRIAHVTSGGTAAQSKP